MKISQTLRKPANWQDFESLCLLLWREEWRSEDIKKNGRNGQAQNGVDICGHRDGENEYSGIQCKCKPGNKALTTDEIDVEIENAKAFRPELKRLVFATTADKEAAILAAEAAKQSAILKAEADREAAIKRAEGEAAAIRAVQQANADGIRMLNESAPTEQVLTIKKLDAFEKAADGQSTKLIIPSELAGVAGLATAVTEAVKTTKE